MKKKSKHAEEDKKDENVADSYNITENEKYIKKLLAQRSVLTKLTGSIKAGTSNEKRSESSNTESNKSQTNK